MTAAAHSTSEAEISSSLEDYLETIYLLVQEQGFARVKDVARARDVKAASVSIALRRLAELDLVRYERREYIALTEAGEKAGRRVFSRHRLLTRFFEEVLSMPAASAGEQACAMEHSLTDEAMDRMVRFFEFLGTCPSVVDSFRQCPMVQDDKRQSHIHMGQLPHACTVCTKKKENLSMSLGDVKPGNRAVVTKINALGALRQRLLDMGVLPDTVIDIERVGLGGDPFWVRCQGARLALRRSEANSIMVRPAE
jgi:DtxR family Mn-dependent transcriptional regulator